MAKTIEIGPYSAYAIAVANGYDGTEEEWLASLVGPKGDTGPQGPQGVQGEKGDTGDTGLQGVQGVQGASITGVKIDGNEHIIVTIHDPATNTDTTIDAGPIDNTSAVQSIQQAAQAAITQVTQAQTAGVNAVNSARDTALQQVAASTEAAQTAATQAAESASSANQDAQEAAESATQAAASQTAASESATQAQQAASDAQSAAGEIDAGLIVETASGETITIRDSAAAKLRGLRLYGKSIQDGVPTPEAPVEIESAGDGGNITAYVFGQNLIDPMDSNKWTSSGEATFEILGNGKIKVTGQLSYSNVLYIFPQNILNLIKGRTCVFSIVIDSKSVETATVSGQIMVKTASARKFYSNPGTPFVIDSDATKIQFGLYANNSGTTLETPNTVVFSDIGLYLGDTSQPWDTYEPMQTLTSPTPNGLPGIPVESGGNYTDAEGQQWVCDEVDFRKGKYIKRVGYAGPTEWAPRAGQPDNSKHFMRFESADIPIGNSNAFVTICNQKVTSNYWRPEIYNEPYYFTQHTSYDAINIWAGDEYGTLEKCQELIDSGVVEAYYILATPIETDLTPEQITAYAALTTYKPNTTITTDSSPAAGIEVNYVADTKIYIDNKLAAISEAVLGGNT